MSGELLEEGREVHVAMDEGLDVGNEGLSRLVGLGRGRKEHDLVLDEAVVRRVGPEDLVFAESELRLVRDEPIPADRELRAALSGIVDHLRKRSPGEHGKRDRGGPVLFDLLDDVLEGRVHVTGTNMLSSRTASRNERCSTFIRKVITSPWVWQPKQ